MPHSNIQHSIINHYRLSNEFPPYGKLSHESILSEDTINIRNHLLIKFRQLDKNIFYRLRHFQPQSGCFNKCDFCSQKAASSIVEFDLLYLEHIIAAIKAVSIENIILDHNISILDPITYNLSDDFSLTQHPLVATGDALRKGVIYCYLDNDPALYDNLDYFIELLNNNWGVKTRIATVGYNRKNYKIKKSFQKISENYDKYIAGLRLSISPYTYGWKENKKEVSRTEFEKDLADFLTLFKKQFTSADSGRKGACIELRFKPLVQKMEIYTQEYEGHFILSTSIGKYISLEKNINLEVSSIIDSRDHSIKLDHKPKYFVFIPMNNNQPIEKILINLNKFQKHKINLLKNSDGIYFGIDVERTEKGYTYAKYFYPKTENRPNSGYIDGERYFLNALLDIGNQKKIYNWDDVYLVIEKIRNISKLTSIIFLKDYLDKEIIPFIKSYIKVLKLANYDPKYLFDKNCTVDTGHICNLGSAFFEYKEIASRRDLPMTPNHDRTFGKQGDLAKEGIVYRLSPGSFLRKSTYYSKNELNTLNFIIEKLDLSLTEDERGQSKEIYKFNCNNIILRKFKISEEKNIIIGQI